MMQKIQDIREEGSEPSMSILKDHFKNNVRKTQNYSISENHPHHERERSPKVSKPAQPYLGTAVIEYFYVGAESQVHDVYRHIITMGQIPEEVQHLVCHHTVFVIFCKTTNQLKQLFSLLFTRICPTGLENKLSTI